MSVTFEAGLYEDPGVEEVESLLSEEGYQFNGDFTEGIPVPENETHRVYDSDGEGTVLRASYVDSPDEEAFPEFDAMVSITAYAGRTDSDIKKAKNTAKAVATDFNGDFLNPQEGTRIEADELE